MSFSLAERNIWGTLHCQQILNEMNSDYAESTIAQTLHYTDKRNSRKKSIVMRDLIFINPHTGEPVKKQFLRLKHLYDLRQTEN